MAHRSKLIAYRSRLHPMIDIKKLKQLVALMAENDLTEMDLEGEGEKITLKRGSSGQVQYVPQPASAPAPSPAPAAPTVASPAPAEAAPSGPTIDSPMVGTYYASPSPDADGFVTVGSKVKPDTVVCIVEAMKVFNEIKAEVAGTIEAVLVENGSAVEYGQPLYRVKPS